MAEELIVTKSPVKYVKEIEIDRDVKMYVIEEKYNPLIKRIEVMGLIYHIGKGTPARKTIREKVANAYNKPIDVVYIRKLESEFGIGRTRALIHIYDSVERALAFEPKHIIQRDTGKKEKGEG